MLEKAIANFGRSLQQEVNKYYVRFRPNLLRSELQLLATIRNNQDLVVLQTDKNLGPAIWERTEYVKQTLREHLLNKSTYKQLSEDEAATRQAATKEEIFELLRGHFGEDDEDNHEPNPERDYFHRSFEYGQFRTPQYYGNPKVHKETLKTRPVVSCVNSIPQVLSVFLDYHLKRVVHLCPSYLRDSWQLLDDLKKLGPLPPGARLITADAVSMYTNIDTDHALEVLEKWFQLHADEIPDDLPTKFVIDGLRIIMKNNVFQFSDTFWLQLNGTAMGTSVACMWATIYYSYHEETQILNKSVRDLRIFFYRRLIDDAFIIHVPAPGSYAVLQYTMNNFGYEGRRLEWEASPLARDAIFLDLTLSIQDNGKVKSTTYVKLMNLHLYIPATSAHPPGLLKSLVCGQLLRFWKQNSLTSDYIKFTKAFFEHLVNRGYDRETLKEHFSKAAERLDSKREKTKSNEQDQNSIFFHLQHHPHQIPKRALRDCFDAHCAKTFKVAKKPEGIYPLNINRLIVAYSRAPNLRDKLCSARLPDLPGQNASDILKNNI